MDVLLVGYQDQDNLGLRYLLSSVKQAGFVGDIQTYNSDPSVLISRVNADRPRVIGFSLIFQYMSPDFASVITALRENGVSAHITMGGHYPSFEHEELLDHIPGLDSIVLFEGEKTLVELLEKLRRCEEWREIRGLACRSHDGATIANPYREPVADLDSLPWPDRSSIDYESHPMATASILGSRGCPWNCSFCSIRPFYEAQGGSLRRLRRPEHVVEEMAYLYRNRGVRIFLFQDDDYLATGTRARRWAGDIAKAIINSEISGKVVYKISCRSDEIREDIIEPMVESGLTHVYLGVESGDEQGLINLNKMLKPETHIRAGEILRKYELSFDFGFMMLEPYSTFESIRNNIDFLDEFVGDGWSVSPFCRMLPYAGTPVKNELAKEGRLKGTKFEPDYDFLDPKIDIFYDWMLRTFDERNFSTNGLCHILRSLLFEASLKLPGYATADDRKIVLRFLAAVCNRIAGYVLRSALDHIENSTLYQLKSETAYLDSLTIHEKHEEQRLLQQIIAYYQSICDSPDQQVVPGPVPGGFDKTWTAPVNASG